MSNSKKDFIKQINKLYKTNNYIRFFYARQIFNISNHLDEYTKILSFLRFILNDIKNKEIKTGVISNKHKFNDFIGDYKKNYKGIFGNIIRFVEIIFLNNNLSLEKHYENMKIRNETLKGIYVNESYSEFIEEDILLIFKKLEDFQLHKIF